MDWNIPELWLTPEQIAILPISERFSDYCHRILDELSAVDIRGFVDDRNETIGKKIRDTELKKIPFMLVIGEKEAEAHMVSVRKQGEGDLGQMPVAEFITLFQAALADN